MKIKSIITTLVPAMILITGLSMSAYADSEHKHVAKDDHSHSEMAAGHDSKMAMHKKGGMQENMKAMQAEMQTIIDTEDKAERQALFTAHKEKMKSKMEMMQSMHGDCHGKDGMKSMMKKGTKTIDHQAETD